MISCGIAHSSTPQKNNSRNIVRWGPVWCSGLCGCVWMTNQKGLFEKMPFPSHKLSKIYQMPLLLKTHWCHIFMWQQRAAEGNVIHIGQMKKGQSCFNSLYFESWVRFLKKRYFENVSRSHTFFDDLSSSPMLEIKKVWKLVSPLATAAEKPDFSILQTICCNVQLHVANLRYHLMYPMLWDFVGQPRVAKEAVLWTKSPFFNNKY